MPVPRLSACDTPANSMREPAGAKRREAESGATRPPVTPRSLAPQAGALAGLAALERRQAPASGSVQAQRPLAGIAPVLAQGSAHIQYGIGTAPLSEGKKNPHIGGMIKSGALAGQWRADLNLNDQISVSENERGKNNNGRVSCIHLAAAYLLHPRFIDEVVHAGATSSYFSASGNYAAVQRLVETALQAPEATRQVVANAGFGAYLLDIAAPLPMTHGAEARILMLMSSHALSVRVRYKCGQGTSKFVVYAFDPNNTGNHAKIHIPSDEMVLRFQALHMHHLFAHLPGYAIPGTPTHAMCASALSLDGIDLGTPAAFRYAGGANYALGGGVDHNELLVTALQNNLPSVVLSLAAQPGHGLSGLRGDGTPAVQLAAANGPGAVAVLDAYAPLLASSGLPVEHKAFLMAGRDVAGVPVLRSSIEFGNTAFTGAYARTIGSLGLPAHVLRTLMESRDTDGPPLLFALMSNEAYADVVPAYAQGLSQLGFTREAALPFLHAGNQDGVSALHYMPSNKGTPRLSQPSARPCRHSA